MWALCSNSFKTTTTADNDWKEAYQQCSEGDVPWKISLGSPACYVSTCAMLIICCIVSHASTRSRTCISVNLSAFDLTNLRSSREDCAGSVAAATPCTLLTKFSQNLSTSNEAVDNVTCWGIRRGRRRVERRPIESKNFEEDTLNMGAMVLEWK